MKDPIVEWKNFKKNLVTASPGLFLVAIAVIWGETLIGAVQRGILTREGAAGEILVVACLFILGMGFFMGTQWADLTQTFSRMRRGGE